jgi:dienelactone hydrolase
MRRRPILLLLASAPAFAQEPYRPAALTAEDYTRAERRLTATMAPLLYGGAVSPTWLADGRFWYRNATATGTEFTIIDPERRTRARVFDAPRIAQALTEAASRTVAAADLPLPTVLADARSVAFPVGDGLFVCDVGTYRCIPEDTSRTPGRNVIVSPDGRLGAFVREHDLWLRELATGRETRLTHDGEKDFAYATNNAGWTKSDRPVLLWSPDSRRIATFKHDGRSVSEMVLASTNVGAPRAEIWKYPLPGDSVIFRLHRVIIDVGGAGAPRVLRLKLPPDAHRSTVCDHIVCGGEWTDVSWTPDGAQLAFVSSSRDHKRATLRVADAATGDVRDVLEETVPTFYESGSRAANWRVLPESNEVIWFSQRDNWGHLYLYDLRTGRLKHQITRGEWNVLQVVHVDPQQRAIVFVGNEREPGDPYFQYLYRVGFDDAGLRLLTPDSAHHAVSISPNGRFFVDSWSTPTIPPVSVVRALDGRKVMDLEQADIAALRAAGWQAPIPFTVLARDGTTELHGLMYRPSRFEPNRKYPIINHIYPGPQSGSVGSRAFSPARGDVQAIAELGFIVVQIDAMGTPLRSKAFHDAYYGNMGDNGLPDQIAGMRQLAERHPWIDLERAGIYGHSGGGFASTAGILRYPDFFKVAVSQAGNHDNRNYEDDWAEKWQGLLIETSDSTTNYDNQANQLVAGNLEGKLLLAHGTLDSNVPPYSTYLVVDALIAANRDFDLIMFPNRRHGFGNEPYMMRRRWDYFVKHLLGVEPPKEYVFGRLRTGT